MKKVHNKYKELNMLHHNVTTHLIYGVWLIDKKVDWCLEDPLPTGSGFGKKTLEKNGLILVEFFSTSRWILGIDESHQEEGFGMGRPIDLGQKIEAKPEWSEKILAYCKRYKVENSEDPQWRIVTYGEMSKQTRERDYYED